MKKNNLGTGLSLTLAFVTGVLGTYLVFMNNPKITKNILIVAKPHFPKKICILINFYIFTKYK